MLKRIWTFCCSLKLAIYLASATTLLLMGGSLLIPFNAPLFGPMDQLPLGEWLVRHGQPALQKTWWFFLAALLMLLFGLNTLCCFLDWLLNLRARWRKTGEYLLHLGVVLVLVGYVWGNSSGWRHNALPCLVGGLTQLPAAPGYAIQIENFRPIFSGKGPPLDMISDVKLYKDQQFLAGGEVRINHPLLHQGLVVTPISFAQQPSGFRMALTTGQQIDLQVGDRRALPNGMQLEALQFLADARRQQDGEIYYRGDRLGNPAFELRLLADGREFWRGWYFVREGLPAPLQAAGLLRPLSPLQGNFSILTVNYDPGAPLAAIGSGLMTAGVLLALISFYRKRKRNDRPEV